MLGKVLEELFIRIWVIIKLTLYFWIYTFAGGIIFGLGAAWKTVNELFYLYGFEYKEITIKRGWNIYKRNFCETFAITALKRSKFALLSYNLYLSVQIKGLIFLAIDFILLFALLCLFATYQYSMILDSEYTISVPNLLKLSFISVFSSFSSFLKIIIGSGIILGVTWQFKGLILFGVIGLLTVWNGTMTTHWREELDKQLESYE
ncbi:membrane protein [Enterococcus faecium]|nr:membrane protein [Enterococcus faecium]